MKPAVITMFFALLLICSGFLCHLISDTAERGSALAQKLEKYGTWLNISAIAVLTLSVTVVLFLAAIS